MLRVIMIVGKDTIITAVTSIANVALVSMQEHITKFYKRLSKILEN
jgi:hypothetical protein